MILLCFDALHPSQQFFSHVRMISCLPVLNQYKAADKVSCSRTQRSDSTGSESRTSNPLITILMLYQLSHCALLHPTSCEIYTFSFKKWSLWATHDLFFMCGSRGGGRDRGSGPLLRNHKTIGFLSNTGPDALKFAKLPSQHSMFGHHWHASVNAI